MFIWRLIQQLWRKLFGAKQPLALPSISSEGQAFLQKTVAFYQQLKPADQALFQKRIQHFLATTEIVGNQVEVTEQDRLLVAAGAIIPVWHFPNWQYFNLNTVYLVPGSFNEQSQFGQQDSRILGLVGTGHISGKMILSQPALHYGFSNSRDKRNLAIHEFAHLIDMMDGDPDGFPDRLHDYAYSMPWFALVDQEIQKIQARDSNIRDYAATNYMEFFAVSTEYFFERPELLKRKHPDVYQALHKFFMPEHAHGDMPQ